MSYVFFDFVKAVKKPWQKPTEDYAQEFWHCARRTPYYEQTLHIMTRFTAAERFEELRRDRSLYWKLRRLAKKYLLALKHRLR